MQKEGERIGLILNNNKSECMNIRSKHQKPLIQNKDNIN